MRKELKYILTDDNQLQGPLVPVGATVLGWRSTFEDCRCNIYLEIEEEENNGTNN